MSTQSIAAAALGGAFTWTFLEYVIHRWLGHDRRLRGNPFGVEHVQHHVQGNYFAPSWKKLLAALVVGGAIGAPAVALAGPAGGAYVAGLLLFYGFYEVVHRLQHVWAGFGPYGRWLRRHHFTHHFVDARKNHGVTTPIWDFVFGTYQRPTVIKVPPRLCMAWLVDRSTGGVRADWADTFVLEERKA